MEEKYSMDKVWRKCEKLSHPTWYLRGVLGLLARNNSRMDLEKLLSIKSFCCVCGDLELRGRSEYAPRELGLKQTQRVLPREQ